MATKNATSLSNIFYEDSADHAFNFAPNGVHLRPT